VFVSNFHVLGPSSKVGLKRFVLATLLQLGSVLDQLDWYSGAQVHAGMIGGGRREWR